MMTTDRKRIQRHTPERCPGDARTPRHVRPSCPAQSTHRPKHRPCSALGVVEHVERNIVPVVHLDQLFLKLGEFMARHIALFRSMCYWSSTSERCGL
jgi:hypothetical protein